MQIRTGEKLSDYEEKNAKFASLAPPRDVQKWEMALLSIRKVVETWDENPWVRLIRTYISYVQIFSARQTGSELFPFIFPFFLKSNFKKKNPAKVNRTVNVTHLKFFSSNSTSLKRSEQSLYWMLTLWGWRWGEVCAVWWTCLGAELAF